MSYKVYLGGLKNSIKTFKNADAKGIVLSRFENFDRMFKEELAVEEGLVRDVPFIKKKLMFVESIDYRVACFYAKFFSCVMHTARGYSLKDIKDLVKETVRYAYNNCICSDKYKVVFKDKNNVLYVDMFGKKSDISFRIGNSSEFMYSMLELISVLGSMDEKTKFNRDWLNKYLKSVYQDIKDDVVAKPYIDNVSSVISFKKFVSGERLSSVSDGMKKYKKVGDSRKIINL